MQRKSELADQLADLDRGVAAYQSSVDRLAGLRRDRLRDEKARPWHAVREQHRAALARLELAQGLETRQQAELSALQQWRTQAAALRSELEAFARDDAALTARQQALTQRVTAKSVAQVEVQSWERRHAGAPGRRSGRRSCAPNRGEPDRAADRRGWPHHRASRWLRHRNPGRSARWRGRRVDEPAPEAAGSQRGRSGRA